MRRKRRGWKTWLSIVVVLGAAMIVSVRALPVMVAEDEAGKWVEIAVASDGTRAFVDERSLSTDPLGVALRQRFTRSAVEAGKFVQIEQSVAYDCADKAVYTFESEELDAEGRNIERRVLSTPKRDQISAGSLAAMIFETVC